MSLQVYDKLTIGNFPRLEYAATEAMNTLWTNLSYSGSNIKSVAVTSCRPDEGKSFVTMNLARTIAETGKRVLVIDADLRRSVIAGRYRVRSLSGTVYGLAHYLSGQCSLDQIVFETNIPNMHLVMAGHEVLNSFSLLDTPFFPDMLKSLSANYDITLVDTPPVGTIIDAAVISRHCDGTLIVVKENMVARKELAEARSQVENVGGKVLGAVLNDVQFKAYGMKKYYYRSYYKYSQYNQSYSSTSPSASRRDKSRRK